MYFIAFDIVLNEKKKIGLHIFPLRLYHSNKMAYLEEKKTIRIFCFFHSAREHGNEG
mgnify:CR=1 FL=1